MIIKNINCGTIFSTEKFYWECSKKSFKIDNVKKWNLLSLYNPPLPPRILKCNLQMQI